MSNYLQRICQPRALRRVRVNPASSQEHTQTGQYPHVQKESWDCRTKACVQTNHASECPFEGCTQRWEGFGDSADWYISFLVIRETVTKHIVEKHPSFINPIDLVFEFDGTYWCLNLCIGSWARCPMEDCNWSGKDGRSVSAHRKHVHPNEGPVGTLLHPYMIDPTASTLQMGEGGLGYSLFRPADCPIAAQPTRLVKSTRTSLSSVDSLSDGSSPAKIPRQCTPHPSFMRRRLPPNPGPAQTVLAPTPRNPSRRSRLREFVRHFGYEM